MLVALEQLFAKDGRVVRVRIDGENVAIPFVAVLYLLCWPYKDRPHPPKRHYRDIKSLNIEVWDPDEEVVWPHAI
jgi:hypothetical protein